MKIICAGYAKTGTKSIAKALRYLGFTVLDWEEQIFDFVDDWADVFQNGIKPDVKRIYQNADAVVDMPGTFFYEEIMEAFPDCKVLLSERDEDSWIKSFVNQLESMSAGRTKMSYMLSPTARRVRYVVDSYGNALFGSCNPKSTYVHRKRYRIHNHRVKSIVPADKLLVYNVKQGWKPLCDFLGCEVPTDPFPHENIKAEITETLSKTRYGQQIKWEIHSGFFIIGSVLVIIVAIFLTICLFNYSDIDS
ncbi:uncharacterized protein LOC144647029 [Oculina patagonica]